MSNAETAAQPPIAAAPQPEQRPMTIVQFLAEIVLPRQVIEPRAFVRNLNGGVDPARWIQQYVVELAVNELRQIPALQARIAELETQLAAVSGPRRPSRRPWAKP